MIVWQLDLQLPLQSVSITIEVVSSNLVQVRYTRYNIMWYSLSVLVTGQWFSPGTPVSSTNKTDFHDITEILLKVALNTIITITSDKSFSYITQVKVVDFSRIFAHSSFDSKTTSYFLCEGQNGTRSSKNNDNESENNFLILWRYFNLVKKLRIIW